MNSSAGPAGNRATVSLVMAAWVLTLGFDFFLHAGLLTWIYQRESPFLLDPMTAFVRIPAGYLSFLLLTLGLLWLLRRLDVRGGRAGAKYGLGTGLFIWFTLALALWSITTARVDTLLAWAMGQGVELGLAGLVLGTGLAGTPMRRIWRRVGGAVVGFVVIAVVLQNVASW